MQNHWPVIFSEIEIHHKNFHAFQFIISEGKILTCKHEWLGTKTMLSVRDLQYQLCG